LKSLHARSSTACSIFTSRCFVTNLNNEDSSASVVTLLPAGYHFTTGLRHLFSVSLPELNSHLTLYQLTTLGHSHSHSYFTTGGLRPVSSSWRQAPLRLTTSNSFSKLNTCGHCRYVTSSLTKGWVCRLQLLLVLVSSVILRSESRGTHDQVLVSQIRDSPNLEGQVPVFISPWNRVARLYPQTLCSLFVASYDSKGYSTDIRPRLHKG
jgi:hypothetical protein